MLKYISPGSAPGQEYHSEAVELEWRLDNFPCLKPGIGGKVEGESFQCGGAKWRLCLYPDGCDKAHAGVMGIFLRLISKNKDPRASYQMWIVPSSMPSTAPPSSTACTPIKNVEYDKKDNRIISYKGQPALMFNELLPAWPDWARDTAQRGGPRTFSLNKETNRDGGSQGSWGFPTFINRNRVATDGYMNCKGGVLVRCTVAVHTYVLRLGSDHKQLFQHLQRPQTSAATSSSAGVGVGRVSGHGAAGFQARAQTAAVGTRSRAGSSAFLPEITGDERQKREEDARCCHSARSQLSCSSSPQLTTPGGSGTSHRAGGGGVSSPSLSPSPSVRAFRRSGSVADFRSTLSSSALLSGYLSRATTSGLLNDGAPHRRIVGSSSTRCGNVSSWSTQHLHRRGSSRASTPTSLYARKPVR
mmetsp:Transcript_28223/g.61850  ORF Transcript_28223/g.61850 Transcript_28223/m.61850 type:complete len:415 (-) Transcript_28223:551-1795(-)|eukprot:CAMPEP_0118957020 /NCGR_PEP_ID=MMETSP1169-20130426/61882_1 /TAXON_ID=36882 /ORGANISM="Pyramimonas obovata, Strain CCMP722" /LENGTH=414 /DNA_ID=CAMNT_0006905075 /DNA_START=296 /DNA_END=1540 /DNA_ORIENTATION=+